MPTFVHPSAEVSPAAVIGDNVKIWNWVQVRERARIGDNCVLSKGVYVDFEVDIGPNCKIQNHASVYHGVTLEAGVFVGPHVCFTNDRFPRAINPDGSPKGLADWTVTPIRVREGAAVGANSTILPGVTVGRFALVGAGSVVTRDVPDFTLVVGNPARRVGSVCYCSRRWAPGTTCAVCGYHGT
jgi:UDP-2-acetamido-3-amino-2,3-dideoxy-glucuronate N-acetyltransferase